MAQAAPIGPMSRSRKCPPSVPCSAVQLSQTGKQLSRLSLGQPVSLHTVNSGNTIWKRNLETQFGNTIWKHNFETEFGNKIWKHNLETIWKQFGNKIWKQNLETQFGNTIWKQNF